MHPNFQYQIICAKFNLSILHLLKCFMADTEVIRRAIVQCDWLRTSFNVNVDERGSCFTKTVLNIIYNFIPHEKFVVDDRSLI